MTNTAILITLGHHASAIYFDGENAIGFEEERLNRKKATSEYPIRALTLLEQHCNIEPCSKVFVSHWFDNFSFHEVGNKYFNKLHFDLFVEKYNLEPVYLSDDFTHHDAHAYSSLAFFREKITDDQKSMLADETVYFIAADGFGNNQEVLSIYECKSHDIFAGKKLKLRARKYGYARSLGLMYQYATSYCGMKENQDEYKFLGYESHIREVLTDAQVQKLKNSASSSALRLWRGLCAMADVRFHTHDGYNGLINSGDLGATKNLWFKVFDDMIDAVGVAALVDDDMPAASRSKRIIVGHFVQNVIEQVLAYLIDDYNMKHVVVSGGIFYNVKLNNSIVKKTDGLFSVVPVAGDQGCGIGMYEAYIGGFKFGDLKLGVRQTFSKYEDQLTPEELSTYGQYIKYFDDDSYDNMVSYVSDSLAQNKIVNIVLGRMEYGPRALCNTTTLALPYQKNVDYINQLNARDTVMPMAPIIPSSAAGFFYDVSVATRIVGSDRYMILTYDYLDPDLETFGGVCHKYPYEETWSGRPQFIDAQCPFMLDVFNALNPRVPALINTSFNAHGRPIVHEFDSVFDSFSFEVDRALQLGKEPPLLVLSDIAS